jgi:hypothetical protein
MDDYWKKVLDKAKEKRDKKQEFYAKIWHKAKKGKPSAR